jgi:D-alanyl-D-alanine carboxypeptidase/D-alanyl-D-alanine-endopeptidase (penicillin-binding protein 4)
MRVASGYVRARSATAWVRCAAEAAVFAHNRPTPRVLLAGVLALALAGVAPGPVALERPRADDRAAAGERLPAPRRAAPNERPADPAAPQCVPDATLAQPATDPPAELAAAFAGFLSDPTVAPHRAGVSVWIDGRGEVLAHESDLALAPASNEKIFTAMGALAVLGADARLETEVRLTADGDLVVVGGGDPTLASVGPHSVAALADQVRANDVGPVPGALIVDETRHDGERRASGWQDWQMPTYTGPLSAFMVDRNRWRADPAYLADPALANGDLLRRALARVGIEVSGPTVYAAAPVPGIPVASLTSAPVGVLVRDMLQHSDNQIADLLLKEVGHAATGTGSLAHGFGAATEALAPLCIPLGGVADDGSGLSRANARSAREWRSMLQAARGQAWWPVLVDGLPLAGRTGTLAGRFHGTAAEANVRAKTGTILGGAALSGYGTTAGGRAFVFSVVVSGPGAQASAGAIDSLVAAVARDVG